jgi:hypothetical protein
MLVLLLDSYVHDVSIFLDAQPLSVALSLSFCTMSLSFEVLTYPSLPIGAVRCSYAPCISFPALLEL